MDPIPHFPRPSLKGLLVSSSPCFLGTISMTANTNLTQAAAAAISTAGAGNISLTSTTETVTLNTSVTTTGTGNIDFTATAKDITMNAGSSASATTGYIHLTANQGAITSNNLTTNGGEVVLG